MAASNPDGLATGCPACWSRLPTRISDHLLRTLEEQRESVEKQEMFFPTEVLLW